ncbi:hypothetical protein [Ileibacterium valens]|uniref:Uncharacterized protein n=2 Tax=Ileibacterium valens TaxID=1862668 RepID=A0A1U7NES9_9FIRM|nr:hypothetical protein [Ileibacterium valens]OLU37699.1 hypothetical protein BM735_10235 [Erysipelotrichaceae bacterium NYU-BL-F16]OLU38317.1 hypothetical protein BO222_08635 [Ileibacterium valens]OLU38379.1 hypothetical protein BO224_09140 [Erysipelotrichaceae bacterium NYU-BL-E8]
MNNKNLIKLTASMLQEVYFAVEYNLEHEIGEEKRNQRLLNELEMYMDSGCNDLDQDLISELFMVLLENDIYRFDDNISNSCTRSFFAAKNANCMESSLLTGSYA